MFDLLIQLGFLLFIFYSLGFYFAHRKKVYAWVDFLWVTGFAVVVFYIGYYTNNLLAQKKFLGLTVLMLVWSIRLASHLFQRILKHGEDTRYKNLIQIWKENQFRNFYFLFLLQGVLNLILSIPLYLTYADPNQSINGLQFFATSIFAIALLGESYADMQLSAFKKNALNQGQICNVGLWKYSRHPNYFFEIVIWLSFGLFCLESSAWGLLPALIIYLLISKVTGIPPAERLALKKYGDLFKNYQNTTNALIPWFKK